MASAKYQCGEISISEAGSEIGVQRKHRHRREIKPHRSISGIE